MTKDVAAIIVAGGQGLRFGGKIRKQYLLLKRKPIVWWSLRAFEKCASVGSVILVVPADDMSGLRSKSKRWGFRKLQAIVPGGASRADSVRQGLKAVPEAARYVAVHDAVRPLITPVMIENVIRSAREYKAALAATPSKDTVKLAGRQDFVLSTPDRKTVWLAQTPQVFERRLLERAHRRGRHLAVTDDAQLVERLGTRVKLVEAPAENIKVTVRQDLKLAMLLMKKGK